ncbi:MAG: PLDc N-terminal domain-containing protein [Bacteroidaceae bacterium]|nr:PLDc N-terminal domain-containing protein [Bacteroidaceae bacterium]
MFDALIPILIVIANILTLFDLIMYRKDLDNMKKILWGIIIWVLPILGMVIYYFSKFVVSRKS